MGVFVCPVICKWDMHFMQTQKGIKFDKAHDF